MARALVMIFIATAAAFASGCAQLVELAVVGETRELRSPPSSSSTPPGPRASLLVIALDGVPRDVLYEMLEAGELPGMTALLGGRADGHFPHAYLADEMLSTLPAVTITGWATVFTGVTPAEHGLVGNEFFIRDERRFAAPIPVSFVDTAPILETYTNGYANRLLEVPTVYHRLRTLGPGGPIWVSMSQFFAGADKLLLSRRSAVVDMVPTLFQSIADGKSREIYEERDQELLDTVVDEIEDAEQLPAVLTVYVAGVDQYAHVAPGKPWTAIRSYLSGEADEMLGELAKALEEHGGLEDRYVVVVSDHGHTEVSGDERHRIDANPGEGPAAVLREAGFRVRPFLLDVAETHPFQAVLAYQGGLAYVYLADRSTCPGENDVCEWSKPPRREDVTAAAEAFWQANRSGDPVSSISGQLDLILVRRREPDPADNAPFDVYTGNGGRVALETYLEEHPRPAYAKLGERLRELGRGRFAERTGDLLLIARQDPANVAERYYFGKQLYESIHGGPLHSDAEIPFIVAHRNRSTGWLRDTVHRVMGDELRPHEIANLLVSLRQGGDDRTAP